MNEWPVWGALGVMVMIAWLGAAGFARLRTPLDRLHCVAFVVAGCGLPLLIAALIDEGLTVRTGKIIVVLVAAMLSSAATTHALGRALLVRGSVPEAE